VRRRLPKIRATIGGCRAAEANSMISGGDRDDSKGIGSEPVLAKYARIGTFGLVKV